MLRTPKVGLVIGESCGCCFLDSGGSMLQREMHFGANH